MDQAKNFAKVTVDGTVEQTATTINLITGDGARLPAAPFNAVLWNATDYPDPADYPDVEIVRVTAISTDALTVTRAQEGTSDGDHALGGKTYKMLAGLTALAWITLLGDVFGSGLALLVLPDENRIRLRYDSTRFIQVDNAAIEIQSGTVVQIGDVESAESGTYMGLDLVNSRLELIGLDLCTSQTESATVAVGTLVAKLAIRSIGGTIVGYIPIYGSIT